VSVFADVRADLAGKLTAAGLAVTLDPGALAPFVLVDLIRSTGAARGVGAWPGEAPVKIVAAPPGDTAAADWLQDTLEVVLVTLGWAPFVPATYEQSGKTLPMYEVTYPVTVPNPAC
jgi:hypothetical protein